MKKEYYLFFMFILAAALVTGSTLSVCANFKYLSQQSKLQQQQQKSISAKKTSDAASTADNSNTSKTESAVAAGPKLADNGTSGSNKMIISHDEQAEITAMLEAMGSGNEDYTLRIKDFQEKNSLPVTGVMDTETLNLLINKATLQKAVQHLND